MPSNQCPISKAQCEQLLAFLNLGAIVGDAYHAASVSTSCIATSGERASGSTSGALSLMWLVLLHKPISTSIQL